ncbi:MAG: citryl-CoA lyase [Alphaproteobacteria bacterium]|nr:citryl-CoA lyase [Alphaproteobacteria bacterium]
MTTIEEWWETSIIKMSPGKIAIRDHPIQDLIGKVTFSQMIWLMLRGSLPSQDQADLLEVALVAGVDHGPQAPSIAAARMTATCGVPLNNVLATGINMLGDVHGGAGEQCSELFLSIKKKLDKNLEIDEAVKISVDSWTQNHGKIIPGFGHRFHKNIDPRAPRIMELVKSYADRGVVSGVFVDVADKVKGLIGKRIGRDIAINIDGATSVVFCELGFDAPLSRGLFCLSRSVGILSHGWEQMLQGGRNKGPMPPEILPKYKPLKGKI